MPHKQPSTLRRRNKNIIRIMVLCVFGYLGWQVWDIQRIGFLDKGNQADCAIVLGAAAYHNKPSPVFRSRIDHAIQLYREKRVPKIILTGGFGKKAPFAESEVALKYCQAKGVPAKDILIEKKSLTTEQNIIQAKELMQTNHLQTALIVSDPWHLKRALTMADKHHIQAEGSATLTSMYRSQKSKCKFLLRELYYLHIWRFATE